MTSPQINIAITQHFDQPSKEDCPLHGQIINKYGDFVMCNFCDFTIPKYSESLDLMARAELSLNVHQKKDQIEHAVRIVYRDNGPTASAYFATAKQRAEAFLCTVGKWTT